MNCTGKNCIMQYDKVDPATCPCVPYCPQATPPKTNGDKIRQMSDDQLAALLDRAQLDGYRFGVGLEMPKRYGAYDWFKWLKAEDENGSD